jgi:hypothetical protein
MERKSAKVKGKRLEDFVVSLLKKNFALTEEDVFRVPSSVQGEDIIMKKCVQKRLKVSFECKNQEKLSIWSALEQCKKNAKEFNPVLVFKRNNSKTYATIEIDFFMDLLKSYTEE